MCHWHQRNNLPGPATKNIGLYHQRCYTLAMYLVAGQGGVFLQWLPCGLLYNHFVQFVQLVMFMFLRNLVHLALCNLLIGVIQKFWGTGKYPGCWSPCAHCTASSSSFSSRPFVPLSVKDVAVVVTREREKICGQRKEYFPQERFICHVFRKIPS